MAPAGASDVISDRQRDLLPFPVQALSSLVSPSSRFARFQQRWLASGLGALNALYDSGSSLARGSLTTRLQDRAIEELWRLYQQIPPPAETMWDADAFSLLRGAPTGYSE